ncbi:MAG: hypothetical protein Q7U07_01675 [Gammaproteobacteria bacterium]|nr:hypothetical protein [Gammaproteobacteria bacterium]
MTILVGIKCKDGIIIGSDSSATLSTGQISTIEQVTKKIEILHEQIIVAGTGQIGLGQRFCDLVDRGYSERQFKAMNGIQMASEITHLAVKNFSHTSASKGGYGALVAFPAGNDIHLCEFSITDLQPELKTTGIWYASMGSGQLIADPFLGLMRSVFWADGMPSLQEGIFIATWTLQHAIDVNAGGVNGPIQLAVLTKDGARMLSEDELTEHQENVSGVVSHLRSYKDKLSGKSTMPVPDVPKIQ